MRYFIVLLFLVASCFSVDETSNMPKKKQEINIGVILPLTGGIAAIGQSQRKGLLTAYDMNHTLSNGDEVKLIILDNRTDKLESVNDMTQLIYKDDVVAVIGASASSNSLAIAPIAKRTKTPLITAVSTNPRITQNNYYVTRACFTDPFQGNLLADYAIKRGYKKIVLTIDSKQDYSVGLSKSFKDKFKKLGGEIIETVFVNYGDKDFTAQVSTIKSKQPQAIIYTGYYTEAALFLRQLRQQGVNLPLIGPDGLGDQAFIDLAKKNANGVLFLDHFNEKYLPNKLGKNFVKFYKKEYKEEVPSKGALEADAYFMLLNAIDKCKNHKDKECINRNLRSTKNFRGISGDITIDKNGNANKPAVVNEVKNGKFVYVDVIKAK